jgi:hypothetical protein
MGEFTYAFPNAEAYLSDISESNIPSRTRAHFDCQAELKSGVVQVHG